MSDLTPGTIIRAPELHLDTATVIQQDQKDSMYLVAWVDKTNIKVDSYWTRRGVQEHLAKYTTTTASTKVCYQLFLQSKFDHCRWVFREACEVISGGSNGMQCAVSSCRTFNPWAEPNIGKRYVCYSCRSSGYHLYLLEG